MTNHVHLFLIIVWYMLLNVTLILFHVSLLLFFFSTNVIIYIGRKYIFFINHCGVTTCGQTDQEPVKLSKVSKVSIVLRCYDHTGIFTCDGCARDPTATIIRL